MSSREAGIPSGAVVAPLGAHPARRAKPWQCARQGRRFFHGRAAIGAARALPAKNAGSADARAVANCSCALAGSQHAAASGLCLVAHTASGQQKGERRRCSTLGVIRAECSASRLNCCRVKLGLRRWYRCSPTVASRSVAPSFAKQAKLGQPVWCRRKVGQPPLSSTKCTRRSGADTVI